LKKQELGNQELWAFGKHAVITGGSSGIGLAIATRLNGVCRKITLLARNQNGKLDQVKKQLVRQQKLAKLKVQTSIETFEIDIRNYKETEKLVHGIYYDQQDQIEIFINCAGGSHFFGKLEQMDFDDIESIFDVNAKAPVFWMRILLPHMKANKVKRKSRKRGQVVMLSSRSGERTLPKLSVYTAAKGSVEKLVEAMQKEYAQHKLVFTLINPGSVNTAFTSRWNVKSRRAHNKESLTSFEAVDPIIHSINCDFAINKVSYESTSQWLNEPGVLFDDGR